MNSIIIEILGWIGSVLIVGAYFMNIQGKWNASKPVYIWCNLAGGIFFVINTCYHAYPSTIVNIIWVIIAIAALLRRK